MGKLRVPGSFSVFTGRGIGGGGGEAGASSGASNVDVVVRACELLAISCECAQVRA